MSSHNPFRTPLVTPNPTGASAVSLQTTTSPFIDPIQHSYPPPPGPPPQIHIESSPAPSPPASRSPSPEHLPELPDAHPPTPPPHSPTTTPPRLPPRPPSSILSSPTTSSAASPPLPPRPGPARPASPPPAIDEIDDPDASEAPPAYSTTPNFAEGESSVDFGPRRPFQRAPQVLPPQQQLYPPPQHIPSSSSWDGHLAPSVSRETLARSRSDVSRPHPPQRPLSEFAREFYAAGPAAPGQIDAEGAGEGSSRPRYAPPPGEPPVRRPRSASANPGAGTSASAGEGADEDGRPTRTPVPGHPLLHDGQVLVYPTGHQCSKCRNTGYKNFDPGHPCRTCWSRFGRPFTGALQYLPWGSSTASSNSRGAKQTYQRPLPSFTPPHLASASSASVPSSSGYPGNSAHRRVVSQPMRTPGMAAPPSPQRAQVLGWGQRPPPGALVVQPGDPRLGGRLCWNCRGSGVVTMFIFEEQCDVCRGVGRTFP